MTKEKDKTTKGHEREVCGFKLTTSKADNGWAVQIVAKPRTRSMRDASGKFAGTTTDARPVMATERDGFRHEGEAMDWAEDWALENRIYAVEHRTEERGYLAEVLDDTGFQCWSSGICKDEAEPGELAELYIKARRRHDQEVLEQRRAVRANYRLVLEDLEELEVDAERTIERAKGTLKNCERERERLRGELRSPQIEFNFVSALEREKVRKVRDERRQTDVEEYVTANDPAEKSRAALRRSKQQAEAPTP